MIKHRCWHDRWFNNLLFFFALVPRCAECLAKFSQVLDMGGDPFDVEDSLLGDDCHSQDEGLCNTAFP